MPARKKRRMARSDLLVALVRAGATGDRNLARTSAEALIADERTKQHNVLADRLSGALKAPNGHSPMASPPPETAARSPLTRDLFVERAPQRSLTDLLLPPVARGVRGADRRTAPRRRAPFAWPGATSLHSDGGAAR
jgi:hypothetical protein